MTDDMFNAAKQLKADDEYNNMRDANRRAADDFWAAFDRAKQSYKEEVKHDTIEEPKQEKTE